MNKVSIIEEQGGHRIFINDEEVKFCTKASLKLEPASCPELELIVSTVIGNVKELLVNNIKVFVDNKEELIKFYEEQLKELKGEI